MSRAPRPDDLHQLRVPLDAMPSPDGRRICLTVKEAAPDRDGHRTSLWLVPTDGSAAERRLTLGARRDASPRWSPDGSTIAFLSDRGAVLAKGGASDQPTVPQSAAQEGHGEVQVWLLPTDGGEARQLTRLPEDVQDIAWSPDGSQLCLVSAAVDERRPRPDAAAPRRDARIVDRLMYQLNGQGFIGDRAQNLWLVRVADGALRRLTSGASHDRQPAWSPDGTSVAFVSDRHANPDLSWRSDVYVVPAEGGRVRRVTGGRGERVFDEPTWSPDGREIAATGHRYRRANASSTGVWVFDAATETEGTELVGDDLLDAGAGMNSDLSGIPAPAVAWGPDGAWLLFGAPVEGSYELWRAHRDGTPAERLTHGQHVIGRPEAVTTDAGLRVAVIVGDAVTPWEVGVLDVPPPTRRRGRGGTPVVRTLTGLMAAWADIDLVTPVARWHETDGRRIQGWLLEAPRRDGRPAPLVVEIHGGPATLYGWALMWEWQCLVAAGISVYACNPRGSQGYGEELCYANMGDWGDGPMADVMAGVDALVADGLADPERLGVTGGSYGGYLTAWIVGHTQRFAAAVSCRGVYDLTSQMLSGDIGGPTFGRYEFGVHPWEDPDLYRRHSPLSYADQMRTPLLIQHAENDLRCPITQAEELFSTLRSMRRPVRLMRTPGESHELTRSGTPYRRVENLERIRDWFVHYLVEGKRGLPPA
ncbi:MAG: S9 family peptidase [Chloroflexota bacterium]